jgi:anti-sigma factor RsiW
MTEPTRACTEILAGISRYLDNELDTTACETIEQHCRHCRQCAALVEGLKEIVGLCRQAASMPLPEAVRQRARQSVQRLLDQDAAER